MFVFVITAFLLFGCVDIEDAAQVIGGGLPGGGSGGESGGVPGLPGFPEIPGIPDIPDSGEGDGASIPTVDPFAAQSARSFLEFIVNMDYPLISQLVTAHETAAALNISEGDPLRQRLNAKTQQRIDELVNNPRATIKELLEAMQLAQVLGLEYQGAYDEVVQRANQRVEAVLADPDAPVRDLLLAAQFVQELGAENSDEATQRVMARIEQKISAQLSSENMCRRQLLDLAEISQLLGFNEIAEAALAKAQDASQLCGTVNFEEKHDEERNNWRFVASANGNLKEFAPGGFSAQEAHTYYFSEGVLTWEYVADPAVGVCITTTKTGRGTVQFTDDPFGGAVVVNANTGEYSGAVVSKTVQLTVTKQLAPQDPEADCSDIDVDDLNPETEDYDFQISISGTTDDRLRLRDELVDSYDGYDYTETTTARWDLHLPDTSSTIKVS